MLQSCNQGNVQFLIHGPILDLHIFFFFGFAYLAHVVKFYVRLRLIRSVSRASTIFVLKLTEIVILRFITPYLLALP